jgi:hypothetical protein
MGEDLNQLEADLTAYIAHLRQCKHGGEAGLLVRALEVVREMMRLQALNNVGEDE